MMNTDMPKYQEERGYTKTMQPGKDIRKGSLASGREVSGIRGTLRAFLFCFLFSGLIFPLLVFYGPFRQVRNTAVGVSWNSLRHQYIARLFLPEDRILRIISGSSAVDPTASGEPLQQLQFGENDTDKMDLYLIKGKRFTGRLVVVYDPTRVKVGYSADFPVSGETTGRIARRNDAAAAINAGGFVDEQSAGTGGTPMGFIIHQGKVVYNRCGSEETRQDTAAFTEAGMLIVGKHSIRQLREYGVREAVSFGPPLVVNGNPTIRQGDGGWGIAPRTAIAQRRNGEVLFLTIDGRSQNSIGATLREVQDLLLKFGAVNAVNLDGGASTTLYFNGKVINNPSERLGERAVPSVFMVTGKKEGEK